MLNVLILMSGSSQAFKDAGFAYPKNLVEIAGQPLLQRVLDRLAPLKEIEARFICVLRQDENAKHHTAAVIHLIDPGAKVIELRGNTSGAACSALMAVDHIDNDDPLIIVNGDQLLDVNLVQVVKGFRAKRLDGGIVVFEDVHPRWSFVKTDDNGRVIETAEKRPISRLATAGCYYFGKGSDFVLAATEMIKKDAHVNGLFYVCPAFNELVLRQRNIGVHQIARSAYRSLAAPSDVHSYEALLRPSA
jgi:dTDP-glucose pyrophosphorylase